MAPQPPTPEKGPKSPSATQLLSLPQKEALKNLYKKYSKITITMDDIALAQEAADALSSIGFNVTPLPRQRAASLLKTLTSSLKNKNLSLLHYSTQMGSSNLIMLLRAIKSRSPDISFKSLVPIFFVTPASEEQQRIFKSLVFFGIEFAIFLSRGAPKGKLVEEILQGLCGFLEKEEGEKKAEDFAAGQTEIKKVEEYQQALTTGKNLMLERKYEEAIEAFTLAIDLNPSYEVFIQRGDSYYMSGHFVPALKDYQQAHKMDNSSQEPFAKVGACCFALMKENLKKEGGKEKAKEWFAVGIKHLKQAEKIVDDKVGKNKTEPEKLNAAPYGVIISSLVDADFRGLDLDDESKTVSDFTNRIMEKTLSSNFLNSEVDPDTMIDQAIILARSGRYREAEVFFRSVINREPALAGPAFNNFAVELRKNGHTAKAFEIYLEVLTYPIPDRDIVLENFKNAGLRFAHELKETNEIEKVISVYKQITSFGIQGKERIFCEQAQTFIEIGEDAQGLKCLKEAFKVQPKLFDLPYFQKYKSLAKLKKDVLQKGRP